MATTTAARPTAPACTPWRMESAPRDASQRFAGKTWALPDFVREWPDFLEDFLTGKSKKRKTNRKAHFTDPTQLALMNLPEADLAWHVRAWGQWVLQRAMADLGARYPTIKGEPTVAYL